MPAIETNVHARDEYDAAAAEYDRRWQTYTDRSIQKTFDRIPLQPGDHVLDVGSGTGALLRLIRATSPEVKVIGVDLSIAMASIAQRSLRQKGVVAVGDAQILPFRAGTFDLVVSSSSFHFWPQPARGLAEMKQVLRPGGRLIITDWCDDFLACRVCDVFLRLRDPGHRRIFSSGALRTLVERAGFSMVVVERYRISWLWGLMTAVAIRHE